MVEQHLHVASIHAYCNRVTSEISESQKRKRDYRITEWEKCGDFSDLHSELRVIRK